MRSSSPVSPRWKYPTFAYISRMFVLLSALQMGGVGCDGGSGSTPTPEPQAAPLEEAPGTVSERARTLPDGPPVFEKVVLSPVYEVDRIYKSMTGPNSTEQVLLTDPDHPELLWIVGFEAVMMAKDGATQIPQDFMCHTNLDLDPNVHFDTFGGKKRISGRLFTLSQGQYRIDLPKGFGIPILSSQVLSLNTQVLNLNMEDGKAKVRHRVIMRFVRDIDLERPYQALYSAGAYGLKLLRGKDGHYGVEEQPKEEKHGPGCLPGENASRNEFDDHKGRAFTGHWVVKPGQEENHTRVTDILGLPFDTTLHYVAVHLHPFAEWIELRDLTADRVVYKAFTKQSGEGVGLAHVDYFSSEEGLPLHKDHEYEIVSFYNNTTAEDQDSMAVMNLYLLDKEFVKPDLSRYGNQGAGAGAGAGAAKREAPVEAASQGM